MSNKTLETSDNIFYSVAKLLYKLTNIRQVKFSRQLNITIIFLFFSISKKLKFILRTFYSAYFIYTTRY